jgi:hypothetical protein
MYAEWKSYENEDLKRKITKQELELLKKVFKKNALKKFINLLVNKF